MRDDLLKVMTEPTVDLIVAGRVLGVGRNSAYEARKNGDIPCIRVGSKFRVPTAKLRVMLGLPEAMADTAVRIDKMVA